MDNLRFTVAEFNQLFVRYIHHQLQLNRLCIHGEITQMKHVSPRSFVPDIKLGKFTLTCCNLQRK